jgi:type IV secretory pathway VirD2 relaxase
MENDLWVDLEWVAVAHFNTRHPHVHIALRGRTDVGPLRLDRDYVKSGIRAHAEQLCTVQLGFRTELDALEAERRETSIPDRDLVITLPSMSSRRCRTTSTCSA